MASLSAAKSKHATLSGTTVDTVTLTGGYEFVEILNRHATEILSVTTNGVTPTAAGDDTEVIPGGGSVVLEFSGATAAVKIIGNGNAYSVTGVAQ